MAGTRLLPLLIGGALAGCSAAGGPFPSLQPRAAEAIDPRAPVAAPVNERAVRPELASRLEQLVAEARAGEAAFAPLADQAESLAAAAGEPQSESWIGAQQALSAAIAARAPTARALGDVDALAATMLQTQGGIAPKELAALHNASGQIWSIDQRQAQRVAAVQRQLGL
jgi:hypothetical protein